MSFDINRLEDIDFAENENALYDYQDELLELFANSPEGQTRAKEDPGMAFWARVLIEYGYNFAGATIPKMTDDHVEELLTDVLPRKISIGSPEDADKGIPAMIAFWEYLKREYELANADDILRYLRSVKPEQFGEWMNDPSRFGMAKSFFMMGQKAGFDMTDEKGLAAFNNFYNASLASSRMDDPSRAFGISGDRESDISFSIGLGGGKRKINPTKAKQARKRAKESRKRNRQRG